jgi:hypothetical protein
MTFEDDDDFDESDFSDSDSEGSEMDDSDLDSDDEGSELDSDDELVAAAKHILVREADRERLLLSAEEDNENNTYENEVFEQDEVEVFENTVLPVLKNNDDSDYENDVFEQDDDENENFPVRNSLRIYFNLELHAAVFAPDRVHRLCAMYDMTPEQYLNSL